MIINSLFRFLYMRSFGQPDKLGYCVHVLDSQENEKMLALQTLLQNPEDITFASRGKISEFESLVSELFLGLSFVRQPTSEGKGYSACLRKEYAVIDTRIPLNSEIPLHIELRLYPLHSSEKQIKMGFFSYSYDLNSVDDLVEIMLSPGYSMHEINFPSRECSLPVLENIPKVIESYAKARDLISQAPSLLANKGVKNGIPFSYIFNQGGKITDRVSKQI